MTLAQRPTWSTAQHLLSTFDGAASELFVIDLPQSQLDQVIKTIVSLPDVVVGICAGDDIEPARTPDDELLRRLRAPTVTESQHSLHSAHGTSEHLQIYIWTSRGPGPFDLEFVFWNDLTFPSSVDAAERERRLLRLVELADTCRGTAPGARCILAPEHNGDPRELLTGSHVIVW